MDGYSSISAHNASRAVKKNIARYVDAEKTQIKLFEHWKSKDSGKLAARQLPDEFAGLALARYAAERRERVASAQGAHTESEWQEIVIKFGDRCVRCSIRGQDTYFGKLTKDHVVPLASGGTDFASNLQPLCRRCNSWKGNREIDFRGKHILAGAVTHRQQAD